MIDDDSDDSERPPDGCWRLADRVPLIVRSSIYLELSDGGAFGLTVSVSRHPTVEVHLRH